MHWNRPSRAALTTNRIGDAQRYMNSKGSVMPARMATSAAGTSMARTWARCWGLATEMKARTVPTVPNHLPDVYKRQIEHNGVQIIAKQLLGSYPQGMIAAFIHARAYPVLRRAIVHDERALDRLDDLTNRHIFGVDFKPHAAADTAQALDNPRLHQTVLNGAGKRIRHIHRLGGRTHGQKAILAFRQHGKHAQGIVGLAGDVHLFSLRVNEIYSRRYAWLANKLVVEHSAPFGTDTDIVLI